jgi:CDP-diacylglycerol--glycerol-3-phosphate 3-phosphatidyltransferase
MEMGYWALQPVATASERAGLNANSITGLSLGLGAAAGVALAFGHLGLAAAATVVSSLGDVLDGLVARRTGTHSKSGAIFDAAADRYDEFFFLAGLACLYHDDIVKLGFVLLALLGSFMVSYGSAKAEALGVSAPRGAMRRAERAVYLGAGALLSPIAAALVERQALPGWAAHAPMLAAVAVVGVVANVSAVRRFGAIMRAVAPASPPAPPTEPTQLGGPGDPLQVSRSHAG